MNDSLEDYYSAAAQAMAKDIDRQVLWGMLEGIGWSRVMIDSQVARNNKEDIVQWLKTNCKHPYEHAASDFLFESVQDANWFQLRWYS